MPRPKPIPTTDTTAMATTVLDMPVTDTVLDTTDMLVLATTDTVLATTARGPLMPSPLPPLRPRLIPTTDTTAMATTVSDMPVTDTVLDTTDMLVLATTDTVLDTTATDTDTDTDTTVKCSADSSHRKISLGITSSSSEKMDRSVWFDPHQCYQFQCHQASPS